MVKKRKICFISERRADYSRLKPIMKAVQKSKNLKLQLVVTGTHLLKNFGGTKKIIKKDGFKIDAIVPMFSKNDKDDGASMVRGMARTLARLPDIFIKLKPDIIFAGFDLDANLAAAITGMHMNIHVVHLQGGERSGTIDEVLRHACTKFAHIHFAATQQSARRIIKLGEDPKYVFNVGSPSLDTIKSIEYWKKEKIFAKYGLNPNKKTIIFLQHPVTSEVGQVASQINRSIRVIKRICAEVGAQALAIYSNNDAGGKRIIKQIKQSGIKVVPHIVYEDFLRLLKVSDVLVGNSSSGIHEAPSFGLPTVNIGTRQQHRERGKNIIDVNGEERQIYSAIKKALFNRSFINKARRGKNPYDNGNTAAKVVKILESIELPNIQKVINY